ncbi:hypothetical protein NEF87_002971 [Candidatus Lokiarchaeum ossiferum]|uniref:Metallo-beta-lactamase domain-containing protein n=1 Tax=Candidatus Lokiarchaeum ossiferum TaxID=2951803 RepID=A0ABY6HTE5_9ARCH|nr:hypothetical protein NEF87_002971 [Candidatus Lokiarchaeum sp. B-35]
MVHQEEKVKIIEVGSRGVAFSFYEDFMGDTTFSYLIKGNNHLFLFDTFCGPDSMSFIKKYIQEQKLEQFPLIIVITHGHWDHFWGNCAFPESEIISHTICRSGMEQSAQADLERMQEKAQGEVTIMLPTLVFEEKISFPAEGIEIFHAPGHTPDQLSVYDNIDKVLIIGDNIEDPMPYINETDTSQYIKTLKNYKKIEWKQLIPGHGEIQTSSKLLNANLDYIQKFMDLKTHWDDFKENEKKMHFINLCTVGKKLFEEHKPFQARSMLVEALKIGKDLEGDYIKQKNEEAAKLLEKLS